MATATTSRLPEIYMQVKDHKQLQQLLVIKDESARQFAAAIGYSSHTYAQRILRGEIRTVTPERAARIARYFGARIDDLFVARLSTDTRQTGKRKAPAA